MALALPMSIATIDDAETWQKAVHLARAIGLTGALCIHPWQVVAANEGFTPTAAEVAAARRVIDAWQAVGDAGAISLTTA